MIILKGELTGVFTIPGGKNQKTGEEYPARDKIQVLHSISTFDGGNKKEIIDLTVDNGALYKDKVGQEVSVPVGVAARGSKVFYFMQQKQ